LGTTISCTDFGSLGASLSVFSDSVLSG
jgi:hypothetical protein